MDASGDGSNAVTPGGQPAGSPAPGGNSPAGAAPPGNGPGPAPGEPGGKPQRPAIHPLLPVVDTAVGAALTTYLQNDRALMVAAIGLVVCAHCVIYRSEIDRRLRASLRKLRERRRPVQPDPVPPATLSPVTGQPVTGPGGPTAAAQAGRFTSAGPFVVLVAAAASVTAAAFFSGYWLLGAGFAHGWLPGLACLLGFLVLVGLLAAWWRYRPGPPGQTRSWPGLSRRGTAIGSVVILGLSAGATLGASDLQPVAATAGRCPSPAELRVLAASEILGPLQAAINAFEQQERSIFRTSCYTVDITAYAAGDDKAADDGIAGGWNLVDGPRPDVWIPASSEELHRAGLGEGKSIGSAPLEIAVPTKRVSAALAQAGQQAKTMAGLYQAVSAGLTLQLPNVRLSETGRLGIADLYPSLTRSEQAGIGKTGSFPTDSDGLLCQASPSRPAAYLVSSLAVAASSDSALGAAACPGQQPEQHWLTAFHPANGTVLDFPFTAVTWPRVPADAARAKAKAAIAFLGWLTGKGAARLRQAGLGAPTDDPQLPAMQVIPSAVSGFTQTQPSARILVAVDDSMPMQPYLGQIGQAVSGVLGPKAEGDNLSARDGFGIWTFPGRGGKATDQAVVPLAPVTPAQRSRVPGAVARLSGRGHSAQFDLVYDAAISLGTQPPPGSVSSIVLLTDGDNARTDTGGNNMAATIATLRELPVKVYVIAFGPAGCAQTPSGLSGDSLNALAKAGGGTCVNAASGALAQQLAQDISTLSTGG